MIKALFLDADDFIKPYLRPVINNSSKKFGEYVDLIGIYFPKYLYPKEMVYEENRALAEIYEKDSATVKEIGVAEVKIYDKYGNKIQKRNGIGFYPLSDWVNDIIIGLV